MSLVLRSLVVLCITISISAELGLVVSMATVHKGSVIRNITCGDNTCKYNVFESYQEETLKRIS